MNLQIMKQFLFSQPNPPMHLVLEETKNANIDNKYWGFNRKIQGFHNIYQ